MRTALYLIEDDPTVHEFLGRTLKSRPDWALLGVSPSLAHAREHACAAAAHVYLVDLGLPDGRGEDVLMELSRSNPSAELLVFTVFGEESRLLGALQAGATGYVLKGCSSEELIAAIEQIREGGAPISPLLARMLLKQFRPEAAASVEPPVVVLTERETDVLKLVAQGYVNKEIARKLGLSPHTIGSHVKNLYRKLSVNTRVQVARIAAERGLV
jgi:DNA-binding NarL/FixJ family response regulator